MGKHKRLDLIFEKHFGIGLRWDSVEESGEVVFKLD